MKKSETIKEIAVALSKMAAKIQDPKKTTKAYGYHYATLDSVLKIIRPLLKENGLAITQELTTINNTIVVSSLLIHISGEWIQYQTILNGDDISAGKKKINTYQNAGAGFTYARRYSISAIFGIASQQDTDGVTKKYSDNENYNNQNYNNQNYNNQKYNNKKQTFEKEVRSYIGNDKNKIEAMNKTLELLNIKRISDADPEKFFKTIKDIVENKELK